MTPIVFDLDGTLVHSMPDILAAAKKFLEDHGKTGLTMNEALQYVGRGVPKLVERLCAAYGLPFGEDMIAGFMRHYQADPMSRSKPYPNVIATLQSLQAAGHPLGICTNKPTAPANAILEALELSQFFSAVIGGDTLPVRKPDPKPLFEAFSQLGRKGIFVGDSEVDAETAARGKAPFILYEHGYRKTAPSEIPHDSLMTDFADLPKLIGQI